MEYLYLIVGVVIGTALGTLVIGIASVGAYDRGYRDASRS